MKLDSPSTETLFLHHHLREKQCRLTGLQYSVSLNAVYHVQLFCLRGVLERVVWDGK